MPNVFDVLKERGFIYQTTDDNGLSAILKNESITFYIGFDPSASSFHVGNLVPIMAAVHMQKAGHKPLMIIGGSTGLIGDPSGKTEMRQMLTSKIIEENIASLKKQLSRHIDFSEKKAELLNNADWLARINYIEFLRDIGVHFSVNKMLTAESVKLRLETGLSFLEFNYSLLQAYDFYILNRDYGCTLQMGGQDQWGNIVAGIDLVRRKNGNQGYGITFSLITNAAGEKFGKSVEGAVWLDPERLSPFDYYQFWRNVDDRDIEKCLGLFTYLPMDEVKRLSTIEPPLLNRSKEILAFEATAIIHGAESAANAYTASVNKFGKADHGNTIETSSAVTKIKESASDIPSVTLDLKSLEEGYWVVKLFSDSGLVSSNSEARRMIDQGGLYLDDTRIQSADLTLKKDDLSGDSIVLRAGKKRYKKVLFE